MNTHEHDDALEQELLELHFGCHEDPESLQRRIDTDLDLAARFEALGSTATLLEEAAREPVASLDLRTETSDQGPGPWGRIAAGFLVAITLGLLGRWVLLERDAGQESQAIVQLAVSGPQSVAPGGSARYQIRTLDAEGEPVPADVRWRVLDVRGAQVMGETLESEGEIAIDVGLLDAAPQRITLVAKTDFAEETIDLELGVDEGAPLLHLSTDKPIYRPGEALRARLVSLDRNSFRPRDGSYRMRIVGPDGRALHEGATVCLNGNGGLAWRVPADAPGGNYALELRNPKDEFSVVRQTFAVQVYHAPELDKSLVLLAETYAPGSEGAATLEVSKNGAGAAGAAVTTALVVDGSEVWSSNSVLDAEGLLSFSFPVPSDVEMGRARVTAVVQHEGAVETAVQPFVIPLASVKAEFMPEGGELVLGRDCRVYAELSDALGRPISGEGRILDDRGREVTRFATEHQGRARFNLRPEAGFSYVLALDSPQKAQLPLPEVRDQGVVLSAKDDVTAADAPLRLSIDTPRPGPWTVAAFCRGTPVGQTQFFGGVSEDVQIALPESAAGVLRVTVFDARGVAHAERLIQRRPKQRLQIEFAMKESVEPGQKQEVEVSCRDEKGEPVQALLGISVKNEMLEQLAPQALRNLEDHTFLLADVDAVDDAEEFFESDADRRVDLLLGTQGWRRFAWRAMEEVIEKEGDRAKVLAALMGRPQAPSIQATAVDRKELVEARDSARKAAGLAGLGAMLLAFALGAYALRGPGIPRAPASLLSLALFAGAIGLGLRFNDGVADSEARPDTPATGAVLANSSRVLRLPFGVSPIGVTHANSWGTGGPVYLYSVGPFSGGGGGGHLHGIFGNTALADRQSWTTQSTTQNFSNFFFDYIQDFDVEIAQSAIVFGGLGLDHGGSGWGRDDALDPAMGALFRLSPNVAFDLPSLSGIRASSRSFAAYIPPYSAGYRILGQHRVYAHSAEQARANLSEGHRDFSDSLYWHESVITDQEGKARIAFDLSDRITTWQVAVDAHGVGRIGSGQGRFISQRPFGIEAKLPNTLRVGDRVAFDVVVTGEEPGAAPKAELEFTSSEGLGGGETRDLALVAGRAQTSFDLIALSAGAQEVELQGRFAEGEDGFKRTINVDPLGFPHRRSQSGIAEGLEPIAVVAPVTALEDSLEATLRIYPSSLAELKGGLEGMLREPSGCFEQVSSSNYPNILVLRHLGAGEEGSPLATRARELLAKGYNKLVAYECKQGGFDWFGGERGHEALTAYGLLQFRDMQGLQEVDGAMVERTRTWLLGRRDGQGGFHRGRQGTGFGYAPAKVTNAYITYSLLAASEDAGELAPELDASLKLARESGDAYLLALACLAAERAGRSGQASELRERLAALQLESGAFEAATSVTSSRGEDLAVETTSFAVLALLGDPAERARAQRGADFLVGKRKAGGSFGATQATVMALKALLAFSEQEAPRVNRGAMNVLVNGQRVDRRMIDGNRHEAIVIELAERLRPGENRVELVLDEGLRLPWLLDVNYRSEQPADDPACRVALRCELREEQVELGKTVALDLTIANRAGEALPMVLARVGLPAGTEISREVMDALREEGLFDFWELRGQELALYWKGFEASEQKELTIDLVSVFRGETTGAASCAYEYYQPESRVWSAPLPLSVR